MTLSDEEPLLGTEDSPQDESNPSFGDTFTTFHLAVRLYEIPTDSNYTVTARCLTPVRAPGEPIDPVTRKLYKSIADSLQDSTAQPKAHKRLPPFKNIAKSAKLDAVRRLYDEHGKGIGMVVKSFTDISAENQQTAVDLCEGGSRRVDDVFGSDAGAWHHDTLDVESQGIGSLPPDILQITDVPTSRQRREGQGGVRGSLARVLTKVTPYK